MAKKKAAGKKTAKKQAKKPAAKKPAEKLPAKKTAPKKAAKKKTAPKKAGLSGHRGAWPLDGMCRPYCETCDWEAGCMPCSEAEQAAEAHQRSNRGHVVDWISC